MNTGTPASVREEVVRQHAEEAAFLAQLRDQTTRSPVATTDTLARLDARLDAHCEGLRNAGALGWEIAQPAWATRLPGECFAALRLAFELREWDRVEQALAPLELLDDADPDTFEQLDACVMALAWLPPTNAIEIGNWWLNQADPLRWSLGLATLLEHRIDPGAQLLRGLAHPAAWTRAVARRGAALLGLPAEASASEDPCARVRLFANLGRLRQQGTSPETCEALIDLGPACPRYGDLACAIGFSGLSAARVDAAIQRIFAGDPQHHRLAHVGAVGVGDPIYIPWMIEGLANPNYGLAASYGLSALTGLDPDARGLICGPPTSDGQPEYLEEPDLDCAWLEPAATQAWWAETASEFSPGRRVMFGRPLPDALRLTLIAGPQRLRALAAWRLGLLRPGAIFAYDAPVARQRRWLTHLRATGAST
ncbi:hypothetical protein ENSA5_00370 [Enhygromyxa salina]|uniref:TIGR02270 family protein n=1 Tax=Enhygromyxa salina TaxID=215803 RepID=A0A2S9YLG4_9BACT|nr:hypothetical protein [Enhygromyxa salina]PRQ05886.1 hypothetical protein ENSA5_00370 [Enhygromyxa salina]